MTKGNVAIWHWKRALFGCSLVLGLSLAGCEGPPTSPPNEAPPTPPDLNIRYWKIYGAQAPDAGAPESDSGTENVASQLGGGNGSGRAETVEVAVPPRRGLN
jgi:hypothetical protein